MVYYSYKENKENYLLYVFTFHFVRTFTDKMPSLAPYPNPITTKFLTLALIIVHLNLV